MAPWSALSPLCPQPLWNYLHGSQEKQDVYSKIQISSASGDIRLLSIRPSRRRSALVQASLYRASLDKNVSYIALSYVWASATKNRRIRVNGADITVSGNLTEALIRVRDTVHPRVLWVDAICINQSDLTERAAQLSMMGRIYLQAEQVWGWVGPAEHRYDKTLASLDTSRLRYDATPDAVDFVRSLPPRVLDAFTSVAQSPYWSRTWIVQETTLARELVILYGDVKLPFRLFYNFTLSWKLAVNSGFLLGETWVSKFLDAYVGIVRAFDMRNKVRKRGDNKQPLKLLHSLAPLQATDARDSIYGLMGVIQHLDYRGKMPCQKSITRRVPKTSLLISPIGKSNTVFLWRSRVFLFTPE